MARIERNGMGVNVVLRDKDSQEVIEKEAIEKAKTILEASGFHTSFRSRGKVHFPSNVGKHSGSMKNISAPMKHAKVPTDSPYWIAYVNGEISLKEMFRRFSLNKYFS